MKKIDFANGKISSSILQATLPMLAAQVLSLLYNIVDRIYIARIPVIGTDALGGVGIVFAVIVIITAFTNMYGSGGAPLFSMARGRGHSQEAERIMDTAFLLETVTAIALTIIGEVFARPILALFGASDNVMQYSLPYMRIYMLGTFCSMIATGLNPFINAQGYAQTGMLTVVAGAVANIVLDPVFIFVFDMGVEGAALATILSQALSAVMVLHFLCRKADLKMRFLTWDEIKHAGSCILNIISLGAASFVMQVTNSLVTICCNNVLSDVGGDLYVSVMTIVSSIRQMVETPILAITEGTSPLISFNYGASRPDRVRKASVGMFLFSSAYAILMWIFIISNPHLLVSIFSTDEALMADASHAVRIYFSAFVFMVFQYTGQTVFKSLGKKKQAIFFSLLRKVIIVVPLTYLLPYTFGQGTDGVFRAEPISNMIGGSLCFITMLATVVPELEAMEHKE